MKMLWIRTKAVLGFLRLDKLITRTQDVRQMGTQGYGTRTGDTDRVSLEREREE